MPLPPSELRANLKRFNSKFSLSHPAYTIHHIGTRAVRAGAERYFKGSLIEIGCGTKSSSLLLGDLVSRHVGIDIPECYHDVSRVDVFATAYALPFQDASFDCAYAGAVIEHLSRPQAMVEEAFRVLKPGGHAIFTAPQYFHLHEEPRDYFRFTRFGLDHMCREAGFEPLEMLALSGFLTTFGFEFGYWLRSVARGPLKPLARAAVAMNNLALPIVDRGWLRREAYTWMNLAVVRKPLAT